MNVRAAALCQQLSATVASPRDQLLAQRLFNAVQERQPLAGKRRAMRLAGIVSCLVLKRYRNSNWGRTLFHKRGGLALRRHTEPRYYQTIATKR
jgi:hypothetical protein